MPAKLSPSELRKTISFQVANLSAADAEFLRTLVATFCDPTLNLNAEALRSGLAYAAYGAHGKLVVIHRLDDLQRN